MYTFPIVKPSLISDRKSSHILEQKHIEYEMMYDRSMLIVYSPQMWWAFQKKNDIAR